MSSLSSYYEKITATGEVKCIDEEIPFEVPSSWCWCRLRDVCTRFSTGPFGTMVHKSDYADDGIPLVNPTNIKEQQIFADNICKVSRLKYKELSAYVLSENDVILARRGDLSKCAVVNIRQVGWLAGTGSFFLHMLDLSLDFFIMLYTSVYAQTYLIGDSVGTTMNNLNQGLLSKMLIPIPPLHEQSRIVTQYRLVIPFVERYTIVHSERTLLDIDLPLRIKKSILQEAIQGKLVPQKAEEGTAQDLLEQIKEEKQKLVKEGKLKKSALNDSVIFKGDDNRYCEKIGKTVQCIEDEIPFEIPESWEWVRLGAIIDFSKNQSMPSSLIEKDTWVLDLEDIEKDSGKLLRKKRMVDVQSKSDKHVFKKGNVLYSKLRPYLNKVIIADEDGACTTEILAFDFGSIYNRYAQMFLMSPYFVDYATTDSYGIKMPRIGSKRGNNALMPLPPVSEQQRIVAQIDKLFEQLR